MESTVLDGTFTVDRVSPVPLYYQVASHLVGLIESETLPVGTRFENEVDLADQLGVSRPTMRRAMHYLVERGMVVRKRGVGTLVVQPRVRRTIELSSLFDDLAKAGRRPVTVVRALDIVAGRRCRRRAGRRGGRPDLPPGTSPLRRRRPAGHPRSTRSRPRW